VRDIFNIELIEPGEKLTILGSELLGFRRLFGAGGGGAQDQQDEHSRAQGRHGWEMAPRIAVSTHDHRANNGCGQSKANGVATIHSMGSPLQNASDPADG
jgi:hypothetical protein